MFLARVRTQRKAAQCCFLFCCVFAAKTLLSNFLPYTFVPDIDLVITYVNDADPEFRAQLKHYINESSEEGLLPLAIAPTRFRDHDDLLYLLRSVDQYGQLFRRVFLVVANDRQVPTWINRQHPKLRIVTHKEIWRNEKQLPNFNSLAIEANLHHIADLSDIFVYANDDYAFLDTIRVEDFVDVNRWTGKVESIVFRADAQVHLDNLVQSKTPPGDIHWLNPALNSRDLLQSTEVCGPRADNYSSIIGFHQVHSHIPVVMVKSVLAAVEQKPMVRELFDWSSASRFRSGEELNTFHFFFGYVQCAGIMGVKSVDPSDLIYVSVDDGLVDAAAFDDKASYIFYGMRRLESHQRPKFLVVNDHSGTAPKATVYGTMFTKLMKRWRDHLFKKSRFEK